MYMYILRWYQVFNFLTQAYVHLACGHDTCCGQVAEDAHWGVRAILTRFTSLRMHKNRDMHTTNWRKWTTWIMGRKDFVCYTIVQTDDTGVCSRRLPNDLDNGRSYMRASDFCASRIVCPLLALSSVCSIASVWQLCTLTLKLRLCIYVFHYMHTLPCGLEFRVNI